jgi:CRISPR system Cascade subunit CasB
MNRPRRLPRNGEHYWEKFRPKSLTAGGDLAHLRRGLGREPGSVPELWRFYTVIVEPGSDGQLPAPEALTAEHAALTLFAVHQQSQTTSMHSSSVELGTALRRLRLSDRYSQEAVDRRVNAVANSSDSAELIAHLRGLVTQLKSITQPLNYTQLAEDIYAWNSPEERARVRRALGRQYWAWNERASADTDK